MQPAQSPITITLRSNSPRGQFSLAPTGPWTPTLALSIPAGGSAAGPFYYLDTRAGSATVTASAFGVTSGTQSETILPGAPVSLRVATGVRTVAAGASTPLSAIGTDQYGNAVPVTASWTAHSGRARDDSTARRIDRELHRRAEGRIGTVTATGGGFTASAPIVVAPGTLRVAGIRYGIGAGRTLLVTVSLVDVRGRPVPNAYVSVLVRRRGYPFATGRGTTLGNGRKTFRIRHKPGCYRTTVVRANANGYRWDGKTPVNRVLQVAVPASPGGDGAATIPAPLGVFPSGQRGRAVNPLALPSEVRILPPPLPRTAPLCCSGQAAFGRASEATSKWAAAARSAAAAGISGV